MESLVGLKVLVTGDTGFIGSWMCQVLVRRGVKVVGVGLKPNTNPSLFKVLKLEQKIKHYTLDITDKKKLEEVIGKENPEIVIHLAAQSLVRRSYDEPMKTFKTNILGTVNLLEIVKEAKIKAIVVATTDKVYAGNKKRSFKEIDALGGGKDAYSLSKAGADWLAQQYEVGIARAANVIGGGDWSKDRLLPDLMRTVYENGKELVIRYPEAVRVWQHVLEMVQGYLKLVGKTGAYNFGPERDGQMKVIEFIRKVETLGDRRVKVKVRPEKAKAEEKYVGISIDKAREKLGYSPKLSFKQALKMSLDWYKTYYTKGDVAKLTNQQIDQYFKL